MECSVRKVYCHDDENSRVYMSLEVRYGSGGEMLREIVSLNYNGWKRRVMLTVNAVNPGIGLVIERIIDIVRDIDFVNVSGNPFEQIIVKFEKALDLKYDRIVMQKIFQEHRVFVDKYNC